MDGLWFVAGMITGVALATVFLVTVLLDNEFWTEKETTDE